MSEYRVPIVAAGSGEVLLMVRDALIGRVKLAVTLISKESLTVTEKLMDVVPAGGVPDRNPAAESVSQVGNPLVDQVYSPLPPEAVKVSE